MPFASPEAETVHKAAPEIPTLGFDEAEERLDRFRIVLAGPGLSEADSKAVIPILRKASRVVLDAGGLLPELLEAATEGDSQVLITPHKGEFARISGGLGGGAYATRAFATRHRITVLLKGNPTLITDGCAPILVNAGGPELASIGTGDVLAGMVGALWARGLSPIEVATSAAYWHGRAAADVFKSATVTAPDLIQAISHYAW